MTENPPALELEHIDKWFGKVRALNDARLWVRRGTVHAVLGENGAGKTTLMRVAYGMMTPDHGVIRVHGGYHERGEDCRFAQSAKVRLQPSRPASRLIGYAGSHCYSAER